MTLQFLQMTIGFGVLGETQILGHDRLTSDILSENHQIRMLRTNKRTKVFNKRERDVCPMTAPNQLGPDRLTWLTRPKCTSKPSQDLGCDDYDDDDDDDDDDFTVC